MLYVEATVAKVGRQTAMDFNNSVNSTESSSGVNFNQDESRGVMNNIGTNRSLRVARGANIIPNPIYSVYGHSIENQGANYRQGFQQPGYIQGQPASYGQPIGQGFQMQAVDSPYGTSWSQAPAAEAYKSSQLADHYVNQGPVGGHIQQAPGNPLMTHNKQSDSIPPKLSPKFTLQDIQILKSLLTAGEKHKWKKITKEINSKNSSRRNSTETSPKYISPEEENHPSFGNSTSRNISPTFVIKQYQSLLGLPNSSTHFGIIGSSLPYVVARNGWDNITENKEC